MPPGLRNFYYLPINHSGAPPFLDPPFMCMTQDCTTPASTRQKASLDVYTEFI